MRLSLRFLVPLILALSALAYFAVPLVDSLTTRWFIRDLDLRAQLVAEGMQEPLSSLVPARSAGRIVALFERAIRDERLYAVAFCSIEGEILYRTRTFTRELGCRPPVTAHGFAGAVISTPTGPLYLSHHRIMIDEAPGGTIVLVHDMSFAEKRSEDTRRYLIGLFVLLGAVVSIITVLVAQLSWRGWIAGVQSFLRGEGLVRPFGATEPAFGSEIRPLVGDVRALIREINEDRHAGEDITAQWTPDTLKRLLRDRFYGDEIIVVSNREPYIHDRTPEGVVVRRPASGLVTAVEPVMRACSGTWIAHGSGSADREHCDARGHVAVPPDDPAYTLRRIWLTEQEERGFYYGFANEGMWPLCHMAHVRPVFRRADWNEYVTVNQRFADAVADESDTEDPVVLVQDYHFALLPRMLRERMPRATIITFWHIPWPNQEFFGICPWREEILAGMLGSTILGFHTAQHSKNFLETVDRYLEARIEHESSTISYRSELTQVESYPISIDWPAEAPSNASSVETARALLRKRLGAGQDHLIALGVDRLDYTKGIVERFDAVEHMLSHHRDLIGRFTFVQIAAPSRSSLEEYQAFENRVRTAADRINRQFGGKAVPAILLLIEHHDAASVFEHYRAADACVVTSLHDGMNLVAKEFVSARDDERGALVLSQFAGASRELHEALLVNPYDIEQTAEALYRALTMPVAEQRERMRAMRTLVKDFNIYRWAGRMLMDASNLRQRQRISARIESPGNASMRTAKYDA
jgi:trehalose-6-phosphate synthase